MSNDKKEKQKPSVRVRKAEFAGQEDKFYAPGDDIRNCYLPIVRAGLEAATTLYPEYEGELCECAKALAEYYQAAFLVDETVPELIHQLNEKLSVVNPTAVVYCYNEIAKAMLMYYGVAQRETSGHKDLTKPQIEKITAVGSILSVLPAEDRTVVTNLLAANRLYPEELDRAPQEGEIIEREDKDRENTEKVG